MANPLLANNQQTKCRVGETDNKERIIPKIWWRDLDEVSVDKGLTLLNGTTYNFGKVKNKELLHLSADMILAHQF